jgi:hypothetical protein
MRAKKKTLAKTPRWLSTASILRALNQAAQDAVEVHRRAGLPLVVWQDGKVAWVPAEEVAAKRHGPRSRRRKPPRKTPDE